MDQIQPQAWIRQKWSHLPASVRRSGVLLVLPSFTQMAIIDYKQHKKYIQRLKTMLRRKSSLQVKREHIEIQIKLDVNHRLRFSCFITNSLKMQCLKKQHHCIISHTFVVQEFGWAQLAGYSVPRHSWLVILFHVVSTKVIQWYSTDRWGRSQLHSQI